MRLSTHTTRPSGRSSSACSASQTLREEPGPGVVPGPVDDLDRRPAPALDRTGAWSPGAALGHRHAGGRADQHAPVPRPRAPARPPRPPPTRSGPAPRGRPRRGRRAPPRPAAARSGPRPRPACRPPPSQPAAARVPPVGQAGHRETRLASRAASCSARAGDGTTTSTPAGPTPVDQLGRPAGVGAGASRITERAPGGRARRPVPPSPRPGEPGGPAGDRRRRPVAAAGDAHDPRPARRCRRTMAAVRPTATPPTRPAPPRAAAARGRSRRPGGSGSTPGGGVGVVLDHPAADPAPVQGDPDPAAQRTRGVQGGGHRVVEPAVDGRDVRHDPHDTTGGRAPSTPGRRRRRAERLLRGRAPASGRRPGRCPPR